jgi:uncharacterized membrane protein
MEARRVEALADGVFAIAMTLLVLELHVPQLATSTPEGELMQGLLHAWPNFLTYAGTFLLLGVLWIGHHNQFHYVRRVNRRFLWLNILFLMCAGFMPFCTALLGTYIHSRVAATLYGVSIFTTTLVLYAIWRYAARNGLLSHEATPEVVRAAGDRILIGLAGLVVGLGVSLVNAPMGLVVYIAVPLSYLRQSEIDRHLTAGHAHDAQ